MLRKVLLLCFSYYALAIVLTGCCFCPEGTVQSIRWSSLSLSNHSYTYHSDSSVYNTIDSTNDFRSKNYMLLASTSYELLASNCNHKSSLFNEAYACKCSDGRVFNVPTSIIGLQVYTVNNYDVNHPAGSEITDRFGEPKYENGKPKGIGPLALVTHVSQYAGGPPYNAYYLYMYQRPDSGTTQQFRVVATLQDSTKFTELTPVMQF